MINVTKTFLPPQEEFQRILNRAWEKAWITNRGELVMELEDHLKEHLDVPNVLAMTNGTLPLQIAIKTLNLTGEIITTPFSYVATASSITWEGCAPIFVDIEPEYLTIDPDKIESAISSKTSAILATHVFGNPCWIEAIDSIAKKHKLKVIYDAAHCFGVNYKGTSIFNYGDLSSCSFHATKVFHTGEGGALFSKDSDLTNEAFHLHNFGHKGHEDFQGVGINAKMSELQAAMGLAVLPHMKRILKQRKAIVDIYNEAFSNTSLKRIHIRKETEWNYSYYPIIFKNEQELLKIKNRLNEAQIFPRRYFYPSLNNLPYLPYQSCPISEDIASRILCLPLYPELEAENQSKIINLIIEAL